MSEFYAPPRLITDPKDCEFYHTVDLPGSGTVPGGWDLRGNIDRYLGGVDFRGKRVLDVGAASGFLSFTMEKKGAEVVSYDLPDTLPWNFVPFADTDFQQVWGKHRRTHRQMNNSYWYCHRLFGSRARMVYGSVYEIPEEIGPVDVSVFGSILIHLRDPFLALQKALQITRSTVVVADILPRRWFWHRWLGNLCGPRAMFLPRLKGKLFADAWWVMNAKTIQRFLEILGFEKTEVTYHWQTHFGKPKFFYTVVGHRTRPAPKMYQVDNPPAILAA